MQWLERSPQDYDRGIRLLTLGRLDALHEVIRRDYVRPGMHVLEVGCGTGSLAIGMAKAGASVTAIDSSTQMLGVARRRAEEQQLRGSLELRNLDATSLDRHFDAGQFDLAVMSLVLSELSYDAQRRAISICLDLLAPGGFLLVLDETRPKGISGRIAYSIVRAPLVVITWLLTRTTTRPLSDLDELARQAGGRSHKLREALRGSLSLWAIGRAEVSDVTAEEGSAPTAYQQPRRLRHTTSIRSIATDLWALVFRVVPPYPSIEPGLYVVGEPDGRSAVLVTGNYDLTVRRVVSALDGRADVWLLVVDSSGINVWCAAGGGFLTADKIVGAVRTADLGRFVEHHALVLPQLCANGVDGWRIRKELGWGVHWGPIRASDIPEYLAAGRRKPESMRLVRFPLRDRLEMVTATLGLYALMILLPVAFLWRDRLLPVAIGLLGLSYFYAVVLPWLPGRDGLAKSVPLAAIAWLAMLGYSVLAGELTAQLCFTRSLGVIALSVFVGAELQGMSPRMRGEQANWIYEALIFSLLLAAYLAVPHIVGWE
jgi:ubiquinone/menaquinone biosynthesis C-methylase UbiE